MLAINRSVDVTPEVNLRNLLHTGDISGSTLSLKHAFLTKNVSFLTKNVGFSGTHTIENIGIIYNFYTLFFICTLCSCYTSVVI